METYTETMETTGRVLFLKVSEKGETYKEMDGVFEIITSDLVLLLLKTTPRASCSTESKGRHSSHAQSKVDRPCHLCISSF